MTYEERRRRYRSAKLFKLKKELMKDSDGKCFYCKKQMKKGVWNEQHDDDMTVDHLIPKSQGGEDTKENLVICCRNCNRLRGTKKIADFAREHFHWLLYPKVGK